MENARKYKNKCTFSMEWKVDAVHKLYFVFHQDTDTPNMYSKLRTRDTRFIYIYIYGGL